METLQSDAAPVAWDDRGRGNVSHGRITHGGWTRVRIVASGVVEGVAVFRCEDDTRRRLIAVVDMETQRGRSQLNDLLFAARIDKPNDTSQLHGCEILARLSGNRISSVWRVSS